MAISDKKKCQTLINKMAEVVEQLQAGADSLKILRTAYQDQNVDPTGTPLAGNVAEVSTWIDQVDVIANGAIATGMMVAKVPTHRNKALEA